MFVVALRYVADIVVNFTGMSVLRTSPFASVELLDKVGVVKVSRTSTPFGDAAAARHEVSAWTLAIAPLDTRALGLLLDWRLTPMTSDPDVLRAIVEGGDALARTFAKHALLFAASLSAPQAERVVRAGSTIDMFTDEAVAWQHVTRR